MRDILFNLIIYLSVINGFIARANFSFDIKLKFYFRIIVFILMFAYWVFYIRDFKLEKTEWLVFISCFVLFIFAYRPELITAIYIIIFVKLIKNEAENKIIKTLFRANILVIAIIFIVLFIGLTNRYLWISTVFGARVTNDISYLFNRIIDGRYRFTFGMNHPNSFVAFIIALISFIFISYKTKLAFILTLFISLTTYYFTDTRSIIVYNFLLYIVYYFIKKYNLKNITAGFPLYLSCLSFASAFFFVGTIINRILSGRPALWRDFLLTLSSKEFLLGTTLEFFVVDNSFYHLIFGTGVVFFIVFLLKYYQTINIHMEREKYKLTAFLTAYLLFNFIEAYLLRFENAATILFWFLVFKSYTEKDEEIEFEKETENIKKLFAGN